MPFVLAEESRGGLDPFTEDRPLSLLLVPLEPFISCFSTIDLEDTPFIYFEAGPCISDLGGPGDCDGGEETVNLGAPMSELVKAKRRRRRAFIVSDDALVDAEDMMQLKQSHFT